MPVSEAEVRFDRTAVLGLQDDVERGLRESVNGRIGVLAKAVVDLHDETSTGTNRRLDRIEALLQTGIGEVTARVDSLRVSHDSLSGTVNSLRVSHDSLSGTVNSLRVSHDSLRGSIESLRTSHDLLVDEVRIIGARVERIAGWIADDEARGKEGQN